MMKSLWGFVSRPRPLVYLTMVLSLAAGLCLGPGDEIIRSGPIKAVAGAYIMMLVFILPVGFAVYVVAAIGAYKTRTPWRPGSGYRLGYTQAAKILRAGIVGLCSRQQS